MLAYLFILQAFTFRQNKLYVDINFVNLSCAMTMKIGQNVQGS